MVRKNIDEVIMQLTKEKQVGISSRFPCRAVMVKNVKQYCELIDKLRQIPNVETVSSEELFASPDVMPRYENLQNHDYANRWVILPGVSEYLRLFCKQEEKKQRFAKLWHFMGDAVNTGRILIPLWGCEAQWFDPAVGLSNDRRQDDFFFNCEDDTEDEQQMSLVVLSNEFEENTKQIMTMDGMFLVGLQAWYEYWAEPKQQEIKQLLLTKRYESIAQTNGNINIKVIKDKFSFIRESLINGNQLDISECPIEAQNLLFDYALSGESVENAILKALNIVVFHGLDVMSKWKLMTLGQKQLVLLWMNHHQDATYLCHCVRASKSPQEFEDYVLHDIFEVRGMHPEWEDESQQLMNAMQLNKDAAFFEQVDKIPAYEERLGFLTGNTKEERIQLLHTIGLWMRENASQVRSCEMLKNVYPEFVAYLDHTCFDNTLSGYFDRYKSYKLANLLPEDEELYFAGVQPEDYDLRYPTMANAIDDQTAILWIDALGAEWLPLLLWSLKSEGTGSVREATITQAQLPTETCFNDLWNQMDVPCTKLDKLDKLAHTGVIDDKDYYACIEEQITFVANIKVKVKELLQTYHRVIITGDHGTSRLAARFFHKRDGLEVPHGERVYSHGRYASATHLSSALENQQFAKDRDGNKYVVFHNYDHFSASGFAAGADDDEAIYGEVHGGATPEELLVPVVVFDNNQEVPLHTTWKDTTVKIKQKKAVLCLNFNKPVSALAVKVKSIDGVCTASQDKKQWTVVLPSIQPGNNYQASIIADGALVDSDMITILPALGGGGDGDLP